MRMRTSHALGFGTRFTTTLLGNGAGFSFLGLLCFYYYYFSSLPHPHLPSARFWSCVLPSLRGFNWDLRNKALWKRFSGYWVGFAGIKRGLGIWVLASAQKCS